MSRNTLMNAINRAASKVGQSENETTDNEVSENNEDVTQQTVEASGSSSDDTDQTTTDGNEEPMPVEDATDANATAERERCVAIATMAAELGQVETGIALIREGTTAAAAKTILNSVKPAAQTTNLGDRMANSQGSTKPGVDGKSTGKVSSGDDLLVALADMHFGSNSS